jgi:hypothetical protein
VNFVNCPEYLLNIEVEPILDAQLFLPEFLEFVCEHIQEDLGIGGGIDMAKVIEIELGRLLFGVYQIPIVSDCQPVWRIHVEWLRLRRRTGASGRISDMTDSHRAFHSLHVTFKEDISD